MTPRPPWYEIVSSQDLEQGDFIAQCSVIVPTWIGSEEVREDQYNVLGETQTYNVIIMTQSCDLVNDKVPMVLVCPYFSVDDYFSEENFPGATRKQIAGQLNDMRRGFRPGFHIMDKCDIPGHEHNYIIVNFQQVYSVPKQQLIAMVGTGQPRIRLISPYREHLAQSFARFFMRVGLPADLPDFSTDYPL